MTIPTTRDELREMSVGGIKNCFPYYGHGYPWDRVQYLAAADFVTTTLDGAGLRIVVQTPC